MKFSHLAWLFGPKQRSEWNPQQKYKRLAACDITVFECQMETSTVKRQIITCFAPTDTKLKQNKINKKSGVNGNRSFPLLILVLTNFRGASTLQALVWENISQKLLMNKTDFQILGARFVSSTKTHRSLSSSCCHRFSTLMTVNAHLQVAVCFAVYIFCLFIYLFFLFFYIHVCMYELL